MALTVEQLEILGAALADVYQQLERAAIADIARRLRKTERLTETAELMAEALQQKGYSPIAIQRQVMRELNANSYFQQEIAANTLAYKQMLQKQIDAAKESARRVGREVVQEAGNLAFRNDLSMWAQGPKPVKGSAFERLIQATKKALTADLLNLTRTTGFQLSTGAMVSARNAYTRALNLALVKTTSGAYSYRQAIAEAVRELAASGLRTVDYASGVSRQLDTAARNAVMTASAQLAGQITMDNAEQTGVDYVEVSSHWGARTGEGHANHAAWQGKIYRIHGSDEKYGNLERETGYPSDPAGLCGYNCRHTFYPFWPGVSEPTQWPKEPEPKEYGGRSYTYYQATQAQRRREREIRALKREADGMKAAGLTQQARQLEGRIRAMTEEYEDFSAAMEIRPKNERLWVCEGLQKTGKSATISMLSGNMATIRQPIEQRNTGKGNPSAVLHFDRPLNNRQAKLLAQLPEYDSRAVVRKRDVNMHDLAALTAQTGVEYAMFTRKGERLIVRGNERMTNITPEIAAQMAADGWRWSGHTHPGIDYLSTQASDGDYAVLGAFTHDRTLIVNAKGELRLIDRRDLL